ncbi:hypothetical protein [Hahella ganghwensis]|uniref:hypothetical protein n=1 Tax=Hahella ganghwensis TaxID=286420 RepID=UPI00037C1EC6|nr:hypothetical protein [Hahella ganghwensis]
MTDSDEFQSRTLVLFADDADVARHIDEAFSVFGINHDFRVCRSVTDLTAPEASQQLPQRIDLFLIAYLGDAERARQTLDDLQSVRRWKIVPTIVFFSPDHMAAAHLFYSCGANSVLPCAIHFEQLCKVVSVMDNYWFDIVSLPSDAESK